MLVENNASSLQWIVLERRRKRLTMELSSKNVENAFLDCLFREGEDTTNHVEVKGITLNIGFHPERLESHREEIKQMLSELPDEFQASKGGGWSFLNACNDKKGNQWTDLQAIMEQLFLLGIGIDEARFQLPRKMWSVLPGGMPYIVVGKIDKEDNES